METSPYGHWPTANDYKRAGHPLPSASYKLDNYPLALMPVSSAQRRLVKLAGARAVLATGSFFCECLKL